MTFLGLLAHNVWRRRLRAAVTAAAVAIGVTAVLALGVLTTSLRDTAVAVLQIGKADFSVSEKGASDVLYSSISLQELQRIRATKGVQSTIGAYVHTGNLGAKHPFFLEIGLAPADQATYGVKVVAGRSYTQTARREMMLGWRAAQTFGVNVGAMFNVEGTRFRVVGIFSTNNPIGDAGGMFSDTTLQAEHSLPGVYTLAFVQVQPGVRISTVRKAIEREPAPCDDRDRERLRARRP